MSSGTYKRRSGYKGIMRRTAWIFGIILLLGAISGLVAQNTDKKLQIIEGEYDFGAVAQNATITHTFWFKAVGNDTVYIDSLKTGCDCISAPLTQQWIAPGDSLPISLIWNTERKLGNSGRYPYIYVRGQKEPERILLSAKVTPQPDQGYPVAFKPFIAELTRMKGFSVDSVAVKIENKSNVPLHVHVVSEAPQVRISLPESVPANGTAIMSLTLLPEYVGAEFIHSVTLAYTGEGTSGIFTIPIRRKIMA